MRPLLQTIWRAILRLFGRVPVREEAPLAAPPEGFNPGDPFSYVGAPKRPRPPLRRAAVAEAPPEPPDVADAFAARRI